MHRESHFYVNRPTEEQGLGCQHTRIHRNFIFPNGLQFAPQPVIQDNVICLQQVHEEGIHVCTRPAAGALDGAGCMYERMQGKAKR